MRMTIQRKVVVAALAAVAAVAAWVPAAGADPVFPTMNDQGGVYWRSAPDWNTPVAQAGNGHYPGTRISVSCWARGSAVPGSNNIMWVRASVVAGPGHGSGWINEHYVNDGAAINQAAAGVPPCSGGAPAGGGGTAPAPAGDGQAAAVANWARAHVGAVWATAAERALLARAGSNWGSPSWDGPTGEWSGDCARFAFLAWYANGVTPVRASTAKAIADRYQAAGRLHGGVPPLGAEVFYAYSNLGHVGIAVDNAGTVVSTKGLDGNRSAIRMNAYNRMGLAYRGWVDPRR